ncbi:MAG: KTSC domain-containing protein [Dokdonella sp.]
MNYPGNINFLEYDPEGKRLTIAFDTLRKMVFYKVPEAVAALLSDANTPDEAFALHVFGKFEWTEIGAMQLVDAPALRLI